MGGPLDSEDVYGTDLVDDDLDPYTSCTLAGAPTKRCMNKTERRDIYGRNMSQTRLSSSS